MSEAESLPIAAKHKSDWAARLPQLTLAAIVLISLLRPGDAPWINDEPLLIDLAWKSNHTPTDNYLIHLQFEPAPVGLQGTRGARYGPLAAWIYQIFLAITHNPIVMVMMRALLVNTCTAMALYWLTRAMGVSPWLAVITLLSPWQLFYSRQLWDNSFCIPLAAMALAAYGSFLKTRNGWTLALTTFCISALSLTHLMSLALIIPMMMHAAIFHWRELLRNGWKVAGSIVPMQLVAWPYWKYFLYFYHSRRPRGSDLDGWLYPLLGAHHLAAAGLGNILGDQWYRDLGPMISNLVMGAQYISLMAYPLVWIGMLLSMYMVYKVIRKGTVSPREHLTAICLAVWFCQSAIDGFERVYGDQPHYYNATWIIYAIFAWLALARLPRIIQTTLLAVDASAMIVVIAAAARLIALESGRIFPGYGTTVAEQMQAVETLKKYHPAVNPVLEMFQWKNYKWDVLVLEEISGPGNGTLGAQNLVVRYRYRFPGDASMEVVDAGNSP